MPLSEHEQRLLEQMEKALYAEDPKFATSLRSSNGRASRGRAALGVFGVLVGMGLLLISVSTAVIAFGVGGFAVMLLGAFIAYTAFTSPVAAKAAGDSSTPSKQAKSTKTSGGFMEKMEDRWRNRHEGGPQQ